ncbi:MAG: hypothetical protein H0W27_00870 [Actinobacteria bacterium]|nr:hypothetical protein [Actinomycetota bacterium]
MWTIAAAVTLTACGGGDGSDGGGAEETVTPQEYASDVCGALDGWVTASRDRAGSLTGALNPTASAESRRDVLAGYIDGLIEDTEALIGDVRTAGVPDVEGGEQIAGQIVDAFDTVKTELEQTRGEVDALPTDDPAAFTAAATQLGTSIQTSLTAAGTSVGGISEPTLNRAFAGEPACSGLGGA